MKLLISFLLAASLAAAYPSGSRIPAGNAGEPGTGTPCASCHRVTLNPSGGSVTLSMPDPLVYQPGVKQTWSLRTTDPDSTKRFGFQLTVSAGTLTSPQGVVVTSNGKPYVTQSSATATATIEWTPPAALDAPVTIYVAGVACRGTSSTNVYTASYTLQPPPPVVVTKTPKLLETNPVLHAATLKPVLASGTVAALLGTDLTPDSVSRAWADAPAEDNTPPQSLKDVRVLVNDAPARLLSIAPDRVTFLVPDGLSAGSATVRLTAPHGETATASVEIAGSAPSLYARAVGERRLVVAAVAGGTLCAASGEFPEQWLGRPANPGASVALAITGLAADTALDRLKVTVGDQAAEIQALEAAGAGLVRLVVKVPELAAGEHVVKLSLDGAAVGAEPLLPVAL